MTIREDFRIVEMLKDGSSPTYYERWKSIALAYQPVLNTDLFLDNKQYTPHDYEHHSENILGILDKIIPLEAFGKTNGLIDPQQLFILCVAITLHDVAMVLDPNKRESHGSDAKKYVLEEVNTRSASVLKSFITTSEASHIADVIMGHCDIKKDGEIMLETIDLISDSHPKSGTYGPINTKLLAALLRLGDELDINSERVRWKNHLQKRIIEDSKKHWRKCEIFDLPSLPTDDVTKIYLRLNEETIRMNGDIDNDVKLILEVENKISSEYQKLKEKVFKKGVLKGWRIEQIEVFTSDSEIRERLKKERNFTILAKPSIQLPLDVQKVEKEKESVIISEKDFAITGSTKVSIPIINIEFAQQIEKWVFSNNLLKEGHYFLDPERFSRDWIDIQLILENPQYLEYTSKIVVSYIESIIKPLNSIFLIGEGYPGLILTSSIAMRLGLPFTYVMREKDLEYSENAEKRISIPTDSKIILITDAIVLGKTVQRTIRRLIDEHKISFERIERIITIFYRPPMPEVDIEEQMNEIFNKTIALNNNLEIEICQKKNCLYLDRCQIKHKYEPTD